VDPRSPYERLAAELRRRIQDGRWAVGESLPTGRELGREFGVATATAQRAVQLLQTWAMVDVSRGRRAIVRSTTGSATSAVVDSGVHQGGVRPAPGEGRGVDV
ncbi:GntR family transcriptional regulator, partial [Micrococcus luteus]